SLEGKQFNRFSNKSGIMAPLNLQTAGYHPIQPQQPPISDDATGQSLGILINKQGKQAQIMRFLLVDDKRQIEENQAKYWAMGTAALQKHEQKIQGAAKQRGGPRL
ncbi:MAG: hypothetical protein K8I00_02680, partial [Candidatus Omnitrophica bacterium]|nr:hypothetical protein [Candidatus Omnitrophota bacterium]